MAKKRRNFFEKIPNILIAKKYLNGLKRWVSHHFKQLDFFLVQQMTRKLLHKNRKNVKISETPFQFFSYISQTTNARRLRFLPIDLAKNFAQNPSIS
jgi:hypothetical protein